jgi:hypothetical protein
MKGSESFGFSLITTLNGEPGSSVSIVSVRFQVPTAASMMFRVVFWDILPCKIIVDRRFRNHP